jgi:hypothetical protein
MPVPLAELEEAAYLSGYRILPGVSMIAATAAGTRTPETGGDSVVQSVGQAIRDAAATASEHAARVRQSASEAGYDPLQTISRLVYTGSYVLAYGIVYAAGLAAQSLPQDNPVMRGFRDGGRAALNQFDSEGVVDQAAVSK